MTETYHDDTEQYLRNLASDYTDQANRVLEIQRRSNTNDLTAGQKSTKLTDLKATHVCPDPLKCKVKDYDGNAAP